MDEAFLEKNDFFDTDGFALTPWAAEILARDPERLYRQLIAHYGNIEKAQQLMAIVRFAQGRERREQPFPTLDECRFVMSEVAKMQTQAAMLRNILTGIFWVDITELGDDLTIILSPEGKAMVDNASQ